LEVFNLRRDAILLYVLFLLVVSVSDQAAAPIDTMTQDSLDFVLSQTEMPIYKMVTPEVNESYTQSLLSSLFGIPDLLPIEDEGRYIANFGNRSFEVDSSDGSLWYADYSKLWNISLDVGETTAYECHIAADEWLAEKGLYPSNAVFVNVGNTSATTYDVDTAEVTSKVLQYHVNYEFRINDLPITGETAQISVIMGEGCEIIGLDWKWRDVEVDVYATSTLIEYESILDTEGIVSSEVEDYELVYDTDEDTDLLFPVYKLNVLKIDTDGIDFNMLLKFDATEFKPRVYITNPSSSITVTPGTSVTFDCVVSLGTPPYTYEWKSDFEGVLSTASTFSISTLSEVLKKGVNVPHAIAVSVWDAEDRWLSDVVAVTIDSDPPLQIDLGIILVGLGAILVIVSATIVLKRKGAFILFFLLMLVSAFTLFPIVSATSGVSKTINPSPPTGAYDDGIAEVGVEWIGLSHNKPLYNNQKNTEGFYNWMYSHGSYSKGFNWHEYSAWEEDFKDASFGGTDSEWVDAVDIAYIHSHAGPQGVGFTSSHDYKALRFSEMRLGDGDLETLAIDACKSLAWVDKYGNNVFERWAPAFQGLHQVCAFVTNSANSAKTGPYFGLYMTGLGYAFQSRTIIDAWFRSCLETEGSDTVSAVFYATKSTNPYQPQQDDPINDHAYGFGYQCSDPTPGSIKHFVYITMTC
jgi:hypothetical protein